MKLLALCFIGVALARPELGKDPSIQEFEKEFHKLYTPEEEAKAWANLKKNEEQIDAENELYEKGEASFEEAVMPWDDYDSEEFAEAKTGALDSDDENKIYFAKGLLDDPDMLERNSPEDQAYLDGKLNRRLIIFLRTIFFNFKISNMRRIFNNWPNIDH